jgi:SAM-dependent methyltransferase
MLDSQMGTNAVWLTEWLCEALAVESGMRVLDLGCGRAMSSIFLAREFGARVWAADLWTSPDCNWRRVQEAGAGELVYPFRVEADALPFAAGFFDAVVSIDAYQYFGTDDLYLNYLSGFVRPGGHLGIAVPGLTSPIGAAPPAHLLEAQGNGKVFWEDECWCFHTAEWWEGQWRRCGRVEDVRADVQPDGWRHWRDFEQEVEAAGKSRFPSDVEALERDAGRTIGFVRVVARRGEAAGTNLYDPSLGLRAGVEK